MAAVSQTTSIVLLSTMCNLAMLAVSGSLAVRQTVPDTKDTQ